jgi:hypothetical protein
VVNNRTPKEDKVKKESLKDTLIGNKGGVYVQNGDNINAIAEKHKVTPLKL